MRARAVPKTAVSIIAACEWWGIVSKGMRGMNCSWGVARSSALISQKNIYLLHWEIGMAISTRAAFGARLKVRAWLRWSKAMFVFLIWSNRGKDDDDSPPRLAHRHANESISDLFELCVGLEKCHVGLVKIKSYIATSRAVIDRIIGPEMPAPAPAGTNFTKPTWHFSTYIYRNTARISSSRLPSQISLDKTVDHVYPIFIVL